MGTANLTVDLPLTEEEFEAAYVMWRMGTPSHELANGFGVGNAYTLDWCFVMRMSGRLNKYIVHFKDPNQSTI